MPAALDGSLPLDDLLNDHFVRDLHTRLFGPIWQWAGRRRQLEGNIGVAPEQIAVELRNTRVDRLAVGAHKRLDSAAAGDCRPCRDGAHSSVRGRKRPHHKASRRPGVRRGAGPRRAAIQLGSREAALRRTTARLRSTSGCNRSRRFRRCRADRKGGSLNDSFHGVDVCSVTESSGFGVLPSGGAGPDGVACHQPVEP
jgi:hypothetical protein